MNKMNIFAFVIAILAAVVAAASVERQVNRTLGRRWRPERKGKRKGKKKGSKAKLEWAWVYGGDQISAVGTLETEKMPDAEGFYNITSISGERNGVKIKGLTPTGEPVPGNEPFAVDNRIRFATQDNPAQLTTGGIGMKLRDGTFTNPFYASFFDPSVYLEIFSAKPFKFGFDNFGPEDSELPVFFLAVITG